METNELYIGLMSGTSLDAIDVALINFSHESIKLVATHQQAMPTLLRQAILDLCHSGIQEIQRMGETDVLLGHLFADSVLELLKKIPYSQNAICAIGSHGQTIRHIPDSDIPFTLQIGDPHIIATKTNITTIADFRRRDMALGGQAAPLAPAFHNNLFKQRTENTGVLNIGGFANLTFLPAHHSTPITGFDTGPGNLLMDAWCYQHTGKSYDYQGEWASSGTYNSKILQQCLADPYFKKSAPKSTGREYFHLDWLKHHFSPSIKPEDGQATLLELTACSIAEAANSLHIENLWVCGGGTHNTALMNRLKELCHCKVQTTESIGIGPDWIEAATFAWLARQTMLKKPGNITSVTGAHKSSVLGAIYPASQSD